MWRLKSLDLKNFRSFKDAHLDFPETGLYQIRGVSGAGKSSIFLGVAFALDILPSGFTGSAQQNWDDEGSLQVTLTLNDGQRDLVIARGKKNFLQLGEEKPVTGSKSIAQAQEELLGFAPEMLRTLTYRDQDSGGLFLSAEPAKKNSFLVSVLGLEQIEREIEVAEGKVRESKVTIELIQDKIRAQKSVVEQMEAAQPATATAMPEEVMSTVEKLRCDLNALKAQRNDTCEEVRKHEIEAETRIQTKIQGLQEKAAKAREFLKHVKEIDKVSLDAYRSKTDSLNRVILEVSQKISKANEQEAKLLQAIKEAEQLMSGTCFTCGQQWAEAVEQGGKRIAENRARLTLVPDREQLSAKLSATREQLKELKYEPDPDIERLQKVVSTLENEMAKVRSQETSGLDDLRQLAQRSNERVHKAELTLKDAESALALSVSRQQAAIREANAWKSQLATFKESLEAFQEELQEKLTATNAEKDFVQCMGKEGFLGAIFSDILQEISVEANRRLSQLANVSAVTVEFGTEIERGRRQVTAGIFVRGHKSGFSSGLSGGMQTSVAQVVDLAVMTVIARRAGRSLGWLFMDEVFDGQGFATKESAHQLLKEYASDRLVLVIDHGTEMSEAFSGTINVDIEDGASKISYA